ncbi:MAG TPA: glycosyltransferase, partial [Gemmatimonadales bacterium]|nr:glycosyltransferase [Gemmatimonadales bacterium]
DRGIEPRVAALQSRGGNPVADRIRAIGFDVADLGIARLRQPGAYRRVAEAIRKAQPDLVHTQLQFSDILGTVAAHRNGIPSISTQHTLEAPEGGSRESWRRRLAVGILRHRADRVIAVSDDARSFAIRRLRLSPDLVTTIHNGIEVDRFAPRPGDRQEARAEFGIPGAAPVVITVAVLRRPKGIQDALAALPSILHAVPDLHYLVVGDGPFRSELEGLAAAVAPTGRVLFAGVRHDVARLLSAADLFLLPSHTEALPTVVAEALAAGLPIVGTTVGGIPEMIDPEIGILVPPRHPAAIAEATIRLLDDPERRRACGRRGAGVARERFNIVTQTERLDALYREVLDRQRMGARR